MKSSEAVIFAISVRRSNQLSYEATDVMNWSFVRSSVPVRNESTMIYHFIVDSFFTGRLEPRNEFKFRIRIKHEQQKRIPPPPPPLPFSFGEGVFSFVNVCRMVLRALILKYIVFAKHC